MLRARRAIDRRFPTPRARAAAAVGVAVLLVAFLLGFVGRSTSLDVGGTHLSMSCGSPYSPADLAHLDLSPPGSDPLLAGNIVTVCNRTILTARWGMVMLTIVGLCLLGWAATRPAPSPVFRGDPVV